MKKYEYINEQEKFWDHSYKVYLSEYIEPLTVNANNDQEALDIAIDHAEKQGWEGLFLTADQVEEKEEEGTIEDYISGGNHGRYLSSFNVRIEKLED